MKKFIKSPSGAIVNVEKVNGVVLKVDFPNGLNDRTIVIMENEEAFSCEGNHIDEILTLLNGE